MPRRGRISIAFQLVEFNNRLVMLIVGIEKDIYAPFNGGNEGKVMESEY